MVLFFKLYAQLLINSVMSIFDMVFIRIKSLSRTKPDYNSDNARLVITNTVTNGVLR